MKSIPKRIVTFFFVGILNTAIDFGIFNLFLYLFGLPYGWSYPLYKGVSFTIACINSYFMNARFTFSVTQKSIHLFLYFFIATLSGMVINIAVATMLFSVLDSMHASIFIRANGAAVAATFISMVWNFIFYNYVVFRQKN
jgi:putative flippase GtrA